MTQVPPPEALRPCSSRSVSGSGDPNPNVPHCPSPRAQQGTPNPAHSESLLWLPMMFCVTAMPSQGASKSPPWGCPTPQTEAPWHAPSLKHPQTPLAPSNKNVTPKHHPQGTPMSQPQLPKIYTTPQSQPPSPGQPPTHYTVPSSPQACWDPMVTLLSLCPQVSPGDSEGLTYAQLQAVTPSTHPRGSSTTPEPVIIYAEVGTRGPR